MENTTKRVNVDSSSPFCQTKMSHTHINNHEEHHQIVEQTSEKSVCSMCYNKRPKLDWTKKEFTYAELYAATQGFSAKNFLSEGGFGSVYKGEILGYKIAVKQCIHASHKQEKEFKSEVDALSTARHENIVMLLGSCSEGNHRLLVYEYVCNGSLDQHLSRMVYQNKTLANILVNASPDYAFTLQTTNCRKMRLRCQIPQNPLFMFTLESKFTIR